MFLGNIGFIVSSSRARSLNSNSHWRVQSERSLYTHATFDDIVLYSKAESHYLTELCQIPLSISSFHNVISVYRVSPTFQHYSGYFSILLKHPEEVRNLFSRATCDMFCVFHKKKLTVLRRVDFPNFNFPVRKYLYVRSDNKNSGKSVKQRQFKVDQQ